MPPKLKKVREVSEGTEENELITPISFEVGKIYADVKVTKIIPELSRSVYFVYAKRGTIKEMHGDREVKIPDTVLQIPVTDEKGKIIGYKTAWNTDEHSMTPKDFAEFVGVRSLSYKIME